MAELTVLESKLGEVLGLAMAAQGATDKIKGLVEEEGSDQLVATLERMHQEAAETEERCTERASSFDGKKTAILDKARETKQEATEMMRTYLGDDADALDGFEFLTMAEAGEAGHWSIVKAMAQRAGDGRTLELAEWALPIQERHLEEARKGSLRLAEDEDPGSPA
ncbi:MAG TPA: hypothetical protein VFA66_03055 [Gaiellaceae bacterium]|nr:hypothetical protein [Gaiellaceae bacterium]